MGFLRKVAGAFVELEDDGTARDSDGAASLDQITRETSELLAQLQSTHGEAADAAPKQPTARASAVDSPPPLPSDPSSDANLLGLTADEVFTAAGLSDGPNSAQRMLKLIAGLSMFPREQQVVMVRAMDAADDAWDEVAVLDDARQRQSSLRRHLETIDQERGRRLGELDAKIQQTEERGHQKIAQIDAEIAALQKQREGILARTSESTNDLTAHKADLTKRADEATRGITRVINAFSQLITFFTGGAPTADRS